MDSTPATSPSEPLLSSSPDAAAAAAAAGQPADSSGSRDLRRQRAWEDPSNWKMGIVYCASDDDRLWVAKRPVFGFPTGWTLNFSNPKAVPVLLALVGAASVVGKLVADAAASRRGK